MARRVERLEAAPPPHTQGGAFVQPQAVTDVTAPDGIGSGYRSGSVEEGEEGGELRADCDEAAGDCDEANDDGDEAAPLMDAAPVEPTVRVEPTEPIELIEPIEPMLVAAPMAPAQRPHWEQRAQSEQGEIAGGQGIDSGPRRTRHSVGGVDGAPAEPPQRKQREQGGQGEQGEQRGGWAGEVGLLHVGPPPPNELGQLAEQRAPPGLGQGSYSLGQRAEEWVACDDCGKWRRVTTT